MSVTSRYINIMVLSILALLAMVATSPYGLVFKGTPMSFQVTKAAEQEAIRAFGDLPVSFVPNIGRYDKQVKYSASGPGYTFFLTETGATYAFIGSKRDADEAYSLKVEFAGAGSETEMRPGSRRSGSVNYLLGADSTKWATDVPLFGQVTYENLYPGIDLTYSGKKRRLKYEFAVAPGADYRRIKMVYAGADSLRVSGKGNLIIDTPWGELVDKKPYVYQESGGEKVPVDSKFVVSGKAVGFSIGWFDRSRPLLIDPGIEYSTFIGGDQYDYGLSIALDSDNNAYISGCTGSTNYPTTPGVYDPTHNGGWDVNVTKLNAAGSALVYSTFIGGTNLDRGTGIAVDQTGNAYIAGFTESTNYPTTPGAYGPVITAAALRRSGARMQSPGVLRQDAFVTKLNSSGTALVYSTYLGGTALDWAYDIAIDNFGNAYVAGGTESNNFPTTAGAYDETFNGASDAFVAKLNAAGSALIFSTYLGGNHVDGANGIALDFSGYVYVTGSVESNNFPITAGVYGDEYEGQMDAFVTKFTPDGSALSYSGLLGGDSNDEGVDIALDYERNVYLVGNTASENFPTTPGAYDTTFNGEVDVFVSKLEDGFTELEYSTFLGGDEEEFGFGITVNGIGEAHVTGQTYSGDFPSMLGAAEENYDIFVARLSSSGGALPYSIVFGGDNLEVGRSIILDEAGKAYVTGYTASADFPTTPGAYDRTFNGVGDAVIVKLGVNGPAQTHLAAISSPWVSTRISKSPIFLVSWAGYNPVPSRGIASFTIRARPANTSIWSDWRTDSAATSGYFLGTPGRTYYLRAKVTGTAGGVWWSSVRKTIVPYNEDTLIDSRSGFAGRYENSNSQFYLGTVRYSSTAGNEIVFKFEGNELLLISTKGPNRSKAEIYIDGVYKKTIDAYSENMKWRQALFSTSWSRSGTHELKVVNLGTKGRSRFDIDGIAVGR